MYTAAWPTMAPMFQPIKPKRPVTRLLAVALMVALAGHVLAAPGEEHEALARVLHELEVLEPLIREAESAETAGDRISFRYDWLRRDINQIKGGLEAHLDAVHEEPRSFTPLRGDYRR